MTQNKCEIESFIDPITYDEALLKAMEHTKKTDNEALFYFETEAKDINKKHIKNIFLGDCDSVAFEYPDRSYDGSFHTHPKQGWCHPSHRDNITGIGYNNIIGCPHKRRKDSFTEFDLRFKDNSHFRDKVQESLIYECEGWDEV
ncbi:hypothetical protein LCGC14_0797940 [marine sediment metagenome]|uniref:JAB domain-containing protein n=1 Tax=marine sediment metagenome TaxID=412755 RepID=A0A0F9SXT4_9ZZZZ